MNLFRRLSATVTGTIEGAVAHLENHEAVVREALKETRGAAARAKVQLARVQSNCESLRSKLHDLHQAEQAWARRALELADADEARALECIRRRNQCSNEQTAVARTLADHERQEKQLADTVKGIESRLREIEHTSSLLRSRQSTAEAERSIARLEAGSACDIDDVIERWKTRIVEAEYESSGYAHLDSFESDFREQEDQAQLKSQLQELMNEENKS